VASRAMGLSTLTPISLKVAAARRYAFEDPLSSPGFRYLLQLHSLQAACAARLGNVAEAEAQQARVAPEAQHPLVHVGLPHERLAHVAIHHDHVILRATTLQPASRR
jgi:hypothetical protein